MKTIQDFWKVTIFTIALFIKTYTCAFAFPSITPTWIRHINQPGVTWADDVVADVHGNVYVGGTTTAAFAPVYIGSNYNSYLIKYDSEGNKIWTRQFGVGAGAVGMTTDSWGNVTLVGHAYASLAGSYLGASDAFVRKYDQQGNVLWTRQFGSGANDAAGGVATDQSGNIFVTGYVGDHERFNAPQGDAFVRKYDPDGNLTWEALLASSKRDRGFRIALDPLGNSYVCGYTEGTLGSSSFGGEDAFVSKLGVDGTLLWTRQFGTITQDLPLDIAVDESGNAYAVGWSYPRANVWKFDESGNSVWSDQLRALSIAGSVAIDGLGDVYVSGRMDSDNGINAFVAKYKSDGSQRRIAYADALSTSYLTQIAADSAGALYGYNATYFGSNFNQGSTLIKFNWDFIPEPPSIALLASFLFAAPSIHRRGRRPRQP